jgi:hypothetical protein
LPTPTLVKSKTGKPLATARISIISIHILDS